MHVAYTAVSGFGFMQIAEVELEDWMEFLRRKQVNILYYTWYLVSKEETISSHYTSIRAKQTI